LRNAGFVTEVYNGADSKYLDFQQVDFEINLEAENLELKQNGGASTVIERNQKEALEYLILNKIEEWE
jgi:ATP phosphoribosyltransferase regulatory subunit